MKKSIEYRLCGHQDHDAMVDFLHSLGDELAIDKREVAEEMVRLLAAKGGALAGFADGSIVALVGYFKGDPSRQYEDEDVCFIYVSGIAQNYRLTRVFLDGYRALMQELASSGFTEIRCQASKENPYTNRLYSRLFRPDGETINRRGFPVNQYSLPFGLAAGKLTG